MCRHWDRWDEGEYRHIFIAELTSGGIGKGVDIIGEGAEWDTPLAPYFDMSEIAWAPDGTRLAYTCKPLTGAKYAVSTDSDIFVYDTETGATTNICKGLTPISGHDAAAKTELPFVGYDKYPVFSPDGTKIAFRSQRRAGNEADKERLMVWNSETGLVKELTKNFDYNATNVIWDGSEALWFLAPMEATHQLCRVDMNGNVSVLTRGDHDINAVSIANGKAVADICTISSPSELYEIDLKDGALTQLTFINQPILDKIRLGKVEKRWVETTDGKQMLTWVILPPDFDPAKKYPTLLYCEGGPQSVVSQFWSYRWNFQLMAANGYIVVAPQPPGACLRSDRSGSTRSRATTRARTSATTSRPSTTSPRSPGWTRTVWAASALRTAVIRSISWPDTTTDASRLSSPTAVSSTSKPCTDRPRSFSS